MGKQLLGSSAELDRASHEAEASSNRYARQSWRSPTPAALGRRCQCYSGDDGGGGGGGGGGVIKFLLRVALGETCASERAA